MHQQGFNQKRNDYFAKRARQEAQEVFERLEQEGELKPMKFFVVTIQYLLPAPEQD